MQFEPQLSSTYRIWVNEMKGILILIMIIIKRGISWIEDSEWSFEYWAALSAIIVHMVDHEAGSSIKNYIAVSWKPLKVLVFLSIINFSHQQVNLFVCFFLRYQCIFLISRKQSLFSWNNMRKKIVFLKKIEINLLSWDNGANLLWKTMVFKGFCTKPNIS